MFADPGRRNRLLWSAHVGFHVLAWIAIGVDLGAGTGATGPLPLLVPASAAVGLVGLAIPALRVGVSPALRRAALVVALIGWAPLVGLLLPGRA